MLMFAQLVFTKVSQLGKRPTLRFSFYHIYFMHHLLFSFTYNVGEFPYP